MTCLEQEVLARLPKSELRPHDLVTAALSRIGYAKSLFEDSNPWPDGNVAGLASPSHRSGD